jgi:hypothetical protein
MEIDINWGAAILLLPFVLMSPDSFGAARGAILRVALGTRNDLRGLPGCGRCGESQTARK